jgi:hypothetical protein
MPYTMGNARGSRQRASRGRALGIPVDLEFLTMIRSWLDR